MGDSGSQVREVFFGIAGGKGLAVLIRAYFDESAEEKKGHGFLAVAGYVFTGSGLTDLEKKWKLMLRKYSLPYFHMAECNEDMPKSNNVFYHLTKGERIEAATEAIKIARAYPVTAVAYYLRQEVYKEILEDKGFDCDPYSFLLYTALVQVDKWRKKYRPKQSLALFFEKGYSTQSRANELLQVTSQGPKFKDSCISHTFFNKDCSYPGQAADLLAWNVRKGNYNISVGKPVRKDTLALIKDRTTKSIYYDRALLLGIRSDFCRLQGNLKTASKTLFSSEY